MKNPKFECAYTFVCADASAALDLMTWLSAHALSGVRVNTAVAVNVDDAALAREVLHHVESAGCLNDNELYETNQRYVDAYISWRDRGGQE